MVFSWEDVAVLSGVFLFSTELIQLVRKNATTLYIKLSYVHTQTHTHAPNLQLTTGAASIKPAP